MALIPAIDHTCSRSTRGEGPVYLIKPPDQATQHVWTCVTKLVQRSSWERLGCWGPQMNQKPGVSERYKDHFIIQTRRWWDSDIFAWSVRLCCIGLGSSLRMGWGMMEDEEMEVWPGLFNLGFYNGQSTQSKEEITHYVECGFPAGLFLWQSCWCWWAPM